MKREPEAEPDPCPEVLKRLFAMTEPTEKELRAYALNELNLDDRDRTMRALARSADARDKLEQIRLRLSQEAPPPTLPAATPAPSGTARRSVGRLIRREVPFLSRLAAVFLAALLPALWVISRVPSKTPSPPLHGLITLANLESTNAVPGMAQRFPPVQKKLEGNTFILPETAARAPANDELGARVYVFRDEPHEFLPVGWMPDGQGISQHATETDTPQEGKYCIRFECQLSQKPWVGVYFLLDGGWEPKRTCDLYRQLDAGPGTAVKCRFWARGPADPRPVSIQCKIGGVQKGAIHDSLLFPVSSPWIELTPEWRMYEIDLTGQDISSIVSGFAWVCDRAHNGERDVTFDLDTIYFVKTAERITSAGPPHGTRYADDENAGRIVRPAENRDG